VFVDTFLNQNALIRVTADILALSPPLIITESQIGELIGKVRKSLESVQ
jgi:beta-alanine--pyruvate transaminase